MAETYRKAKIEQYVIRLQTRKQALHDQLESSDFEDMNQFLKGQISAIDLIAKEISSEFQVCSDKEE